ncbi:hypothetical protein BH09PLA1_BH09PLA1_30800 [soil metagenome]
MGKLESRTNSQLRHRNRDSGRVQFQTLERRVLFAAGGFDPSFGNDGASTVFRRALDHDDADIAVTHDGRIVAAVRAPFSNVVQLIGFNSDGSRDNRFGKKGDVAVTMDVGFPKGSVRLIPLPSGKLLVEAAGVVVRLNEDGSTDSSFAAQATTTRNIGLLDPFLAPLPDGGAIVVNVKRRNRSDSFSTSRIDANGVAIPNSRQEFQIPNRYPQAELSEILLNQVYPVVGSDGGVFIVGFFYAYHYVGRPDLPSYPPGIFVCRLKPDGSADRGFGTDGMRQFTYAAPFNAGHVIAAGNYELGDFQATGDNGLLLTLHGTSSTIFKILPDGSIASDSGVISLPNTRVSTGASLVPIGLLAQADGKVVAASVNFLTKPDRTLALTRYNSDGTLDQDFHAELVAARVADAEHAVALRSAADGSILLLVAEGDDTHGRSIIRRIWRDNAPVAELNALPIESARSGSQVLTVMYRDDRAIDTSSFDNRDLRITGPNDFVRYAKFDRIIESKSGGGWVRVRYKLAAPDGSWVAADNGTYSIRVRGGQAVDTDGNGIDARTIGSFVVNVAPSSRVMQRQAGPQSPFASSRIQSDKRGDLVDDLFA